jgi:hypothetical protein
MTATYSEQELLDIANATVLTGMAVVMVDMGLVSTAIETVAMTQEMLGAASKYPNNTLIQAAFSEAAMRNLAKGSKPDIKPEEVASGAVIDKAITAVNNVVTAIGDKATPAEIQEYKTLVYAVGEAVANAAGSGLFGSGSPKVSDKEAGALTKIKAAMGL